MRALIVDDDAVSLEFLNNVLDELGYEVVRAHDGKEALALLGKDPMHLVITDWEMPEMNGLELCRAIREGDYDGYVYIVMLTGRDGGAQKIEGLHAGADAFLVKPLNPAELLVSLKTAERILALETRDLAMFALAKLSESRDPETGAHIERVQSYARLLAQFLSSTERYHDVIDAEFVRLIYQTTPLHDIGKVGIPDNILLKPGKLTEQEMAIMRTHVQLGAETLEASLARFPNVRFLQMARDIALTHHERWDGKGYPRGLKGKDIPLAGRIVALADVYDAISTRRIYREAMAHGQAKQFILRERGAHFDPDVIDAFLQVEKQFIEIRERYRDEAADEAALLPPRRNGLAGAIGVATAGLPGLPAPLVAMGTAAAAAAAAADAAKGKRLAFPEMAPPQNRVLIADDDPCVREMLENVLNAQGVDCITCSDGSEALSLLDAYGPTMIISDWVMPGGVDGLELCRRVRARCGSVIGRHVHFIMLTAHSAMSDLTKAFDAGVDDFLGKPFKEGEVIARIRAGLRALALYEELYRQHQGSRQLNEQLTTVNTRLEKLAITDDLTGLYNRRQAMHRLEEHWAMSERYQRPLAVISLDIDHFKVVNDTYGHSAGDAVLKGVSEVLRQCVRSTDNVCRIGGEEFLIILPFQTLQEAEICAHRCRQATMERTFESAGNMIRVTISAGLASRRSEHGASADLLHEADEALYAAKRAGRNAVRAARADGSLPLQAQPGTPGAPRPPMPMDPLALPSRPATPAAGVPSPNKSVA